MAYSQQTKNDSEKVSVQHLIVEDIVEQPIVSPYIKSKFKTLQDWLFNILGL